MRRDDRAVTDIDEIYGILSRCDTIRVGMNGDGYPYIIPMTFGCEKTDDKIVIYIHSAADGRKWDILNRDSRVCIEADLFYKVEKRDNGDITAVYESVIGTGDAVLLTEKTDKINALKCMLSKYKESGFPVTSCQSLPHVAVFRIELNEVCGKRNR